MKLYIAHLLHIPISSPQQRRVPLPPRYFRALSRATTRSWSRCSVHMSRRTYMVLYIAHLHILISSPQPRRVPLPPRYFRALSRATSRSWSRSSLHMSRHIHIWCYILHIFYTFQYIGPQQRRVPLPRYVFSRTEPRDKHKLVKILTACLDTDIYGAIYCP